MNSFKIYRSAGFESNTNHSYPLKYIEIVTNEISSVVYIYDVGEFPYYDVLKVNNPFENITSFESAISFLNRQNIFVSAWYEVENLYVHESNAIIREDIRADIANVYENITDKPITKELGLKFIKNIKDLSGESSITQVILNAEIEDWGDSGIEYNIKNEILSYKNTGYIMIRNPINYENWGFVCKDNEAQITILVEFLSHLECSIYDQRTRKILYEGDLVNLKMDLPQENKSFLLNSTGINEKPFSIKFRQ